MLFLPGISKAGRELAIAAYERLSNEYPSLTGRAIVASIPLPKAVHWLDDRCFGGRLHAYGMCLNHWLQFLPVPVVLFNAEWLQDCETLRQRYGYDVATGYHPGCDCPVRYILYHEIAHFVYVRMGREKQTEWERSFEPGKPSGYSTTPEEGFCEAFAGYVSGQQDAHFKQAAAMAVHYRRSRTRA